MSTAVVVLAVVVSLALWVGSLYFRSFGPCPKCHGTGHVRSGRGRRAPKCARCKGLRRVQRPGSRAVHRIVRTVRQGQATAARHQHQEED